MGCIAMSKTNPLHLYAGTGEANNSGDSNFGRGFLVSTDGGTTWTLRTGPGGIFNSNRMACSQVAVDPTNENVAYAAMSNFPINGVFAGGITGVYKTTDGGVTWTNVTSANGKDNSDAWSDVVVDPNTPSTVYAAVGFMFGAANNAVYKSIDSGATWTQLSAANAPVGAGFGRISLGLSTTNGINVLYAAAEDNTTTSGLARFVRSDDAGASFNLLTASNFMGAQGWYDADLAVDPTNSAIAYATGAAGTNSVLRTINSGGLFADVHTAIVGNTPHADHHATAFDASGRLLDGDDGGIWRLDAATPVTWTNLNGNLATIQFQGIGLHPTNSQIVVGGSQDNGTEVYSGTATWAVTDGGDGGPAKFSQQNTARVYHASPIGSFGPSAFFRRSDNTGATWSSMVTGITDTSASSQNFYAPFVVDPANGDHVLFGAAHVWQTTNAAANWSAIATAGTGGFNSGGNLVDAIGIGASSASTIYAATGGTFATTSQIFVTTDGGTTWTEHDLPAFSGRVNEIQVDPANSQIAYAVTNTFSGTGANVFKTINGGTAWTSITGNLATVTACTCALPVWSLQIESTTGKLFIGADDGVYVSANGGTTWARFGTGFPNAQVFQIELNSTLHILGAATHGRGAWEILTQSPTASEVTVAGRVLTSAGSGIRGATVVMTDMQGNVRRAMTNSFGYYSFENVQSGEAYTFAAISRGFTFSPRVISLNDSLSDLDFTGSH